MQRFPVFTERGVRVGSFEILSLAEQIEINCKANAVTTFLVSEPSAFFRGTIRVTESQFVIVFESKSNEFTDADDEFALSLPQG